MNHISKFFRTYFYSQQTAAVGLIITQCAAMFLLMETVTFSICAAILACCGLFAKKKGGLLSLPGDFWIYILAAVFVVKYSFAPKEFGLDTEFLFTDFSYEVAMFCIVVELGLLYRKQNEKKLPPSFLVFAVIGLVFTCNVRLNRSLRLTMLVVTQLFLFMSMFFSMKSRRVSKERQPLGLLWRNTIMWGVLLGSAVLGTTSSVFLHRYEHTLENLLSQYLSIGDQGPARSGFSNRGGLSDVSSWQEFGGEKVALRVESDRMPGYLRGKVFDEFQMNRWMMTDRSQILGPAQRARFSIDVPPGDHLYLLTEALSDQNKILNVWPVDNETAGHCFAPIETVALSCVSRPLSVDRNFIVTRPNEKNVASYTLIVETDSRRIEKDISSDFLQLPAQLDERIHQTAQELFANAQSSDEKIQIVQQHFQKNYQYKIGIEIPDNEDPLGYFLEQRPPAHCEYFATASAVLLRLGGVPTRYVTGYLAQEQNRVDKMWMARRKDAHAWVEAYDSQKQQWILVESTPSDGVPLPSRASVWQYRREALSHFFRSLQDQVMRGNYLQVVWLLLQPLMWGVAVVGVATGILMLLKRQTRRVPLLEADASDEWSELLDERQKMDKLMARIGFQREPGETSTRFAERIEAEMQHPHAPHLARWYHQYTVCRFRPGTRKENVDALRIERETLKQKRLNNSMTPTPEETTHA